MTNNPKTILLTILCGLFLSACASIDRQPTEIPETTEFSLLQQGATCTGPNCWEGLIPGETTFADARQILETRYGNEKVRVSQHYIEWHTNSRSGYHVGSVSFNDQDSIDDISIVIDEGQLTVAEMIAQIGEPSFVWVARAFSSESLCAGSWVTYPTLGILAGTYPEAGSVGISSTQSIARLTFMTVNQAQTWEITDHMKFTWQGYQDYCTLFATTLGTRVPSPVPSSTPHTNSQ